MNPFHVYYEWKLAFIQKTTNKQELFKILQDDKECLSQLKDKKAHRMYLLGIRKQIARARKRCNNRILKDI